MAAAIRLAREMSEESAPDKLPSILSDTFSMSSISQKQAGERMWTAFENKISTVNYGKILKSSDVTLENKLKLKRIAYLNLFGFITEVVVIVGTSFQQEGSSVESVF